MMVSPLLCSALAADPAAAGGANRPLVVVNARVVTASAASPEAEAFAVIGGRFVAVGDAAAARLAAGPGARELDASGAVVVPGFIDAHLHLLGEGFRRLRLDLVGTRSRDEVIARVREAHRSQPGPGWLSGRGWDQNDWPDRRYPAAADLDAVVSDRPVLLRRIDGHAAWVNSKALAAAGIDAGTKDPPGGRILRDEGGRPTGILIDNAVDRVLEKIPRPTRAERARAARVAAKACVEKGLTSVHEPGVDLDDLAALEELCASGELPLRVYAMLTPGPALERYLGSGPVAGACNRHLSVRAVKIYADGALGSRGAALLADYADDPGNRGLLTTPIEEVERLVRVSAEAGFQPCIHAIGDRANRLALDVFERVLGQVPALARLRPRIEHAQLIAPEDIPRFARLGVIASMQPTHATSDGPWVEARVGPSRVAGAYAWRKLLRSGAALAFGSDAPVESVDPLLGIHAARTRQDPSGKPTSGWQPEERLDGDAALAAYTIGAARAAGEEQDKGSIEVGKLADFVILSGDPRRVEGSRVPTLRVLSTWVDGRMVYESGQ